MHEKCKSSPRTGTAAWRPGPPAGRSTISPAPMVGAEVPVHLVKSEVASADVSVQNVTTVSEKVTSHASHRQAPVVPELLLTLPSSLGVLPAEDIGTTVTTVTSSGEDTLTSCSLL